MPPETDPQPDLATPATPDAPRRRALLVVNTKARQGRRALDDVTEECARAGVALHTVDCPDRDALADLVRAHAREVDMLILGGGDGTLNAAAPGLADTGLPLAVLPLGTANDLARTLGIPLDVREAARLAVSGRVRRIDLGEVNGVPFFNVASIGMSVDLARELTREMKRRWGTLGYAVAAFRVAKRMAPFHADIRIEGVSHHVKSVQIGVGNGRHYGGGMTVEESAAVDDGRLDVYSIDLRGWWEWPLLYPAFRKGRHGVWENVHTWDCTEVEIVTRRPRPVNTDGELTTHTPARFRVRPGAVAVVCPDGGPDKG
ncbi:MAG TPA: lipid kinase [Azospirillum sp.]|nr:lipid kinase [Azospirillum sp.]